jgi:hypothetical protein
MSPAEELRYLILGAQREGNRVLADAQPTARPHPVAPLSDWENDVYSVDSEPIGRP